MSNCGCMNGREIIKALAEFYSVSYEEMDNAIEFALSRAKKGA